MIVVRTKLANFDYLWSDYILHKLELNLIVRLQPPLLRGLMWSNVVARLTATVCTESAPAIFNGLTELSLRVAFVEDILMREL